MIRRTVWACSLIAALLLLLPAFSSATSTDRTATVQALQPGSGPAPGIQPGPGPQPNNGSDPGDDDTPNRDGTGGVTTPARDSINAAEGRKVWIWRDLSAWLHRHVIDILRANR